MPSLLSSSCEASSRLRRPPACEPTVAARLAAGPDERQPVEIERVMLEVLAVEHGDRVLEIGTDRAETLRCSPSWPARWSTLAGSPVRRVDLAVADWVRRARPALA